MNGHSTIRLLIVDDHPVVREGLRTMVQNFASIDLVAVCATGEEALKAILNTRIDIVLADMRMLPVNGIELLRSVRKQAPSVKVIVFSSYELEEDIYQALKEGAFAYINKYASAEDLLNTIHRVHSGERVFSKRILETFGERSTRRDITTREFQILEMMAKGLTNREIGHALQVSEFTVKNQIKSICTKLEVSHRTEATRVAIDRGLIPID
jgi:two-component system NarL family response regulator